MRTSNGLAQAKQLIFCSARRGPGLFQAAPQNRRETFSITFSPYSSSCIPCVPGNPPNFPTTRLLDHPITCEVSKVDALNVRAVGVAKKLETSRRDAERCKTTHIAALLLRNCTASKLHSSCSSMMKHKQIRPPVVSFTLL